MRRLALRLAAALAALVIAPAALADGGPLSVVQGGAGVASPTHPWVHYVTVPTGTNGTLLEAVDSARGEVVAWTQLHGSWGIPTLATYATLGQGVSPDGRTLVLADTAGPYGSPSRFVVLDLNPMRNVRTITLKGSFSFDALSPDGSRMYLIQYTYGGQGDLNDYIVRGYDLRTNRLLPGRIADRTQKGWVMHGTPIARTWSAGGRWVYTLYTNPGSYPFVHALDTKRGVAHCIQLPWEEDRSQAALFNLVLNLRNGGRTLAVDWKSGRPWVGVAVGSWQVSNASGGSSWAWVAAGSGGALVLLVAGGLFLRRRRGEELEQHAGEEFGLA